MTRATRVTRGGARTNVAIREAAASLFYEHGYEATSLRTVASEVGIQVGSLYNHISGKEELLTDIMVSVMDELLEAVNKALVSVDGSALDRFKAAVDCHIRYHAEHARETFIGNTELRALSDGDLELVLAKRAEYERLLQKLIKDVAKETGADILDAKLQTYSILAQGAHVSSWYKPGGPKSLDKVVNTYIKMALRQLGVENAA
ncbi:MULTISPECIES: TetR/AcrR family transcriptional regulator [Rhodococcus]|uniref:TetR/AcrR family transcriptional regulator n=1 Tax=Rhodococcus TaxID=1827 RepID=UPI000ACA1996|nr:MULTISPECIES: TetR/AcrR family transcriptional regulator [Rhodococcus]MDI9939669.1 TetR/AcrR family transcriptional regulator [Rhodococcus sp. IEGM 1351]MDJ0415979.1 TetR/AcrR family transcriptional regulator [Rhodococcus opacus]MDX5967491.1 TetR/AcrR family transcriptional regulator [Rhodococcus opacus]WKN55609.1 TetR/AcrR family transcriptional regulator [Rhodococcus opacus]CAG7586151.1 HTH-type transcriptional repressor KstR2 [Rhodococcus opacus]